ncbi:MAG: serine/threonine protein kinase [Phycisphaerales bacterium]|nr:serine/threonine protein kinase [Phycisphaerales bacterium]
MSDSRHFQRVAELFEAARSRDGADRDTFLREACGADEDLYEEVSRLLSHHEAEGAPLAEPIVTPGAFSDLRRASEPPDPVTINQYLVKRRIGVGGMGVVYLAEQEKPRREVAIKVIRPSAVTAEMLKRFELEASLLGRLQHPGIAQIYEAGTHDDGAGPRPYFAMEFVDGLPLLEYFRQEHLDPPARLEAFARVCDAVEHAHQRGIVHRDLKPGNILVDRSGQPKILDFGVARATDSDLQASTLHTDVGMLIGTVAYMSPEQVLGRAGEIDTRSDVYALGVVLYEALADRLPYDLRGRVVAAAVRTIAEEEPTPLTAVSRSYRGDLDTIVHKALEKAPDRRYQSASAFAEDLRRFLNNQPIIARPATTMYQFRKFARRNRALVAAGAATLLALGAGAAVATVFAIGQARALAESERQRATADAVNDFLTEDLIEQADPDAEADRQLTLLAALDRATPKIEGRFTDAPLAEARLRMTIGKAYRHLDRLDAAEEQFRRARALYEAGGESHAGDVLHVRMELATILMARADYERAEPEMRGLLATQRAMLGDDDVQTMASINNLGAVLLSMGRYDEAEPLLDEALERRERVLGEQTEPTATTINNLATLDAYTGHDAEAAEMFAHALTILRKVGGDRHPQTLQTMANLGGVYSRLRRYDDAAATLEAALPLHRDVLGPEHRSTLLVASNLAAVYGFLGRQEEKRALLSQTLEVQRRVLGEQHLDTLVTRLNLAKVAYDGGDFAEAEPAYADLVRLFTANYPEHFLGGVARTMHGRCLMELECFEEAEAELTGAYDQISGRMGAGHNHAKEIASTLADLYTRWGRAADAATWSALGAG